MTAPGAEPRVRYVTWAEYGEGVYRSQVIRLVELLAERTDAELLALVSRRTAARFRPPQPARLLQGPLASRWPLGTFRLKSPALTRELETLSGRGVLHCRGPLATHAALEARPAAPEWRVLHDYRDFDAVPIEEEHGASRWTRRMAALERAACRRADLVSVVSKPLRDLVVDDYGVPADRVVVHPTGTDVSGFAWSPEARAEARAELGAGPGPLLVYVGSAAYYQLADVCLEVGAILARDAGATLLVLSQQADVFREAASHAGFAGKQLIVRTASPAELNRLLCAADAALLPRRRSPVNAVASPVKFAEYLAAGVPVVTVRGTGPFSDQVERENLGAVADGPEAESVAAAAAELLAAGPDAEVAMRARCREAASRDFDLPRIADSYLAAYRRMLSATSG